MASVDPFEDLPEAERASGEDPFADLPEAGSGDDGPGVLQTAEDLARSFAAGTADLQRAGAWLVGQAGAEQFAEDVRENAKWFEEGVLSGQSEEAQEDRGKRFVETDEEGNYSFGEGATDPGTIAHTIARSGPSIITSLLGGGAATGGLRALGMGSKSAAATGFGASEGIIAGAQSGASSAREVRETSFEQLREQSPAFRKLEDKIGDPEAARETLADEVSELAATLGGLTAAAAGAPAGVGLSRIFQGRGLARTRAGATGKGALIEAAQESVQEGGQSLSENYAAAAEQYDPDREITEDALNNMFAGAVAGGSVGGALGFAAGPDTQAGDTEQTTEEQPDEGDTETAPETEEQPAAPEQDAESRRAYLQRRERNLAAQVERANNPGMRGDLEQRLQETRDELASMDAVPEQEAEQTSEQEADPFADLPEAEQAAPETNLAPEAPEVEVPAVDATQAQLSEPEPQTEAPQEPAPEPQAEPADLTEQQLRARATERRRLAEQTQDPNVRADLQRQAQADEAEVEGRKPKLSRQERQRRQRIVRPESDDLLTAIQKLGGLNTDIETDFTGRLKGLERDRRPGMPGLEQSGDRGETMDGLAERLHELGYLRTRDARELEDRLLEAEARPVYSLQADEAAVERETEELFRARERGDAEGETVEPTGRQTNEETAATAAEVEREAPELLRPDEPPAVNQSIERMRARAQELAPDDTEGIIEQAARENWTADREQDALLQTIADAAPQTSSVGGRRIPGVKTFEEFQREADRGELEGQALGFLDLDNFKALNDSMGHELGDDVIRAFGQTLREYAGPRAVYRRSGDEFIVQGDDRAALEDAMRQAQNDLEQQTLLAETPDGNTYDLPRLRFSVGTAEFDTDTQTTLRKAEEAQDNDKRERKEQGLRSERRQDSGRRADDAGGSRRDGDEGARTQAGTPDVPERSDDERAAGNEGQARAGADEDLAGPVDRAAQAQADADAERRRRAAESPPVESEDGDLFSGRSRQTDIEDVTEAPAESGASSSGDIDARANEAATSPENDRPEPTPAQKEAGNYRLGDIEVQGFDIAIENPRGSWRWSLDTDAVRSALQDLPQTGAVQRALGELDNLSSDNVDALFKRLNAIAAASKKSDAKRRLREALDNGWRAELPAHYGYFRATEGNDGDAVDAFVGRNTEATTAYVVDQTNPDSNTFDEHKVMLGYESEQAARDDYLAAFEGDFGQRVLGAITPVSTADLRSWIEDGDQSTPYSEAMSDAEGVREDTGPSDERRSVEEEGAGESGPDLEQPESGQPGDREGARPAEEGQEQQPINDFGERLEGARKFETRKLADTLGEDVDVEIQPLSESFPQPNYKKLAEEGVSQESLALVALMRNEIPNKPRQKGKLRRWGSQVQLMRVFSWRLLSGEFSLEQLRERAREHGYMRMDPLFDTAEVLASIEPESLKQAAQWRLRSPTGFTEYRGESVDPSQPLYMLYEGKSQREVLGQDRDQAIERAREIVGDNLQSSSGRSKQTKIDIRMDRKTREIFLSFGPARNRVRLRSGFDSAADARKYLNENRDALQDEIDALRAGPRMRQETNEPRVGIARRDGDVTPERFTEAFGFRGVQFGNTVAGSRRQQDMNQAYDALMDLADVLDVPSQALSLNGELGLAFGARGKGGRRAAAAHFEPDQVVINLTKNSGPGSLAHEWLHAVDNYFGRQAGGSGGTFISDSALRPENPDIRPEALQAWQLVEAAVRDGSFAERSTELDRPRSREYFGTPIEKAARAFERYVYDRMAEQDMRNDYLANIDLTGGAYPTETEMDADGIRTAYDRLFDTLQVRETDRGVAMFSEMDPIQLENPAEGNGSGLSVDQVTRAVADARLRMVSGPPVNVVQSIEDLPRAIQPYAREGAAPQGVAREGQVWLIADNLRTAEDARRTLAHEAVGHVAMEEMLGEQFEPVMERVQRLKEAGNQRVNRIAEDVRRRYGEIDPMTESREIVAIMAEEGVRLPIMKEVIAAVRRFLRRIGLGIRWSRTELEALIAKAGRRLQRDAAVGASRDDRPAAFSRAADAVNMATDAFRRWFGDSKVTDEQGNPTVVYHGTQRNSSRGPGSNDFEAFNTSGRGKTGGTGAFFSSSPSVAATYTPSEGRQDGEGTTYPVYLSLQNPLIVDAKGADWNEITADAEVIVDGEAIPITMAEEQIGAAAFELQPAEDGVVESEASTDNLARIAREEGFDGAIFRNVRDSGPGGRSADREGGESTIYVAFRPEQIKSAVGNRGTYDPNDPRMAFSRREDAESPKDIAATLRDTYEGLQLEVGGEAGGVVTIDKIVVPESERQAGIGTAVMKALTAYADRTGSTLALSPSNDFGGNVARLRSFYANFGFTPNRGRNRDFEVSESMLRRPGVPRGEPMFSRPDPEQSPELERARRKAGLGRRRGTLRDFAVRLNELTWEQTKAMLGAAREQAAQGIFDRFHGIKLAERSLGNLPTEQSGYVAARMSTGMSSVMRGIMLHGAPKWDNGMLAKVEGSRGMLEILEPVRGDLETFLGWMVGRRANRLMQEGREQNLTQEEIDALVEAGEASPRFDQFETVADELDRFKKHVLDVAEDAGLIDPETRPTWDQSDYIPFYRVAEESDAPQGQSARQSLAGQSSGIRTLRGGEDALNDPLENMIMNFSHLIDASMKNHAVRQVVNNIGADGVMEEATSEYKPELIPLSQIRSILKERGVDTSIIPNEALRGMQKMWASKPPADEDIIRMMDEGKARYFRVNDPLLLRSLTAVRDPGLNHPIVRTMRGFKRILTRGVTADPAFMARNYLRDALHAWVINEDHFRVGIDSIRGATKSITEQGGMVDMMFAGGSFQGGYVNASDPGDTARSIRRALREQGYGAAARDRFVGTVVDTPVKFWEKYTKVGDAIENASREAVYEAAITAGKSRQRAVFEAKDLMDYSMRGDWAIMQFFGDVLPFFNARVQGLYKLGRAGANNPKQIAARGSMIAMASLALLALNKDDERYEELPEWDKDTYWHLFFPESIVGADAAHIRIPKPFEIGVLFGTIPERWARNALGSDDTEKTFERMLWSVRETFAFDPVPQAFKPGLEVWGNRDTFMDSPIEGLSDQGKLKEARYDPRTSATMKALGQITGPAANTSPKQLEHLWRGYTGSMGMYLLDLSDVAVRSMQGAPPKPEPRIDDYPVIQSFLRADPARSTKYLPRLYDLHREANQIYRTLNEYRKNGNEEKAREILDDEDKQAKLAVRGALEKGVSANRKISRTLDQIHRDRTMTPAEKREAIDELIAERNQITKEVVQSVDKALTELEEQ